MGGFQEGIRGLQWRFERTLDALRGNGGIRFERDVGGTGESIKMIQREEVQGTAGELRELG